MKFYWEIKTYDGMSIEIPPESVDIVKNWLSKGSPIKTTRAIIPANQVKSFSQTDKPYRGRLITETVSQIFNTPEYDEAGGILCRWVKKPVTKDKWDKYYSPIGYKRIGEESGMTIIAFLLPVHLINPENVEYLTTEEIAKVS